MSGQFPHGFSSPVLWQLIKSDSNRESSEVITLAQIFEIQDWVGTNDGDEPYKYTFLYFLIISL